MTEKTENTSILQNRINFLVDIYNKGEFINALSYGKSLIKTYPKI